MRQEEANLGYYKELFELAPAAYVVTDEHCVIEDANDAAAKLLRRPLRELLGKPLTMFVEGGERPVFHKMVTESLIAMKQLVQPLTLQPLPGQEIEVLYSAAAVHDERGSVSRIHWLLLEAFGGSQGELL